MPLPTLPAFPLRATSAAAVAVSLLVSCATLAPVPFSPDRTARAPLLDGYGRIDVPITTATPPARELFNRGVLQAYAFNEAEAVRVFKAALAQDPSCGMCAWGVAWQLGPNINDPDRDKVSEALQYVDYALKHLDAATPRERALVDALALRYAHSSKARETAPMVAEICGRKGSESDEDKVNPLDVAYAERMRGLADAYPADPDILSLYAEAEIIATDADTGWTADGKPNGRFGEVAARIERLLPTHPDHTGINHYMIHIADALPVAGRAVAAADRLGKLAPRSPHLVHMPAHIYVHVGRFNDATRVNQEALAADVAVADAQKAQGFTVTKDWGGHNRHFLWYAALMAGREDVALDTAAKMAERAAGADNVFGEYVRSLGLISLVRLERWERVLAEPQPLGETGIAKVWHEYARGIAQARLGRLGEAQASLVRLQEAAVAPRKAYTKNNSGQKMARAMLDTAEGALQAEVALAQGRFDEAIAFQIQAMAAVEKIDAREPPALADGTRLALGHIQAKAGHWADAEKTWRAALAEHPGSGWALRGLVQALNAQRKVAEAAAYGRELDRSWDQASPHLRARPPA